MTTPRAVRFQRVIRQTDRRIFEIKLNPRSCNVFPAPVVVPSVIRNLVAFVMAVRRTRDVDDAALVDISAVFRPQKRQNTRPWGRWIECTNTVAITMNRAFVAVENDAMAKAATNARPKARIKR
jgi:hypothetical protein